MIERDMRCMNYHKPVVIQIWPQDGYITFKNGGIARVNHMSDDNSVVIDFFCDKCANSGEPVRTC